MFGALQAGRCKHLLQNTPIDYYKSYVHLMKTIFFLAWVGAKGNLDQDLHKFSKYQPCDSVILAGFHDAEKAAATQLVLQQSKIRERK